MATRFHPKDHHRRSILLPNYDYRSPGAYFVTICTHEKDLLFEDPVLKHVAENLWQRIPSHFSRVQLDAVVVMPNHIHGIIILEGDIRRGEASQEAELSSKQAVPAGIGPEGQVIAGDASPLPQRPARLPPGSLGAIVGNYKSVTARRINNLRRTPGMPVWQRNYYEHIVRDNRALDAIRQYIVSNPDRWDMDTYNPTAARPDPQALELWRLLR
jgi:REP element-mobilizing transposase RayT